MIRIFHGDLPDDKKERKRSKPDLEALVLLPPFSDYSHGALFAIGSGSTKHRERGALLPLDEHGQVHGSPRVLDLSRLFVPMHKHVGDFNIEGAVIVGDRLMLLQRGNKGDGINALVSVELSRVLLSIETGDAIGEMTFDMHVCDLGSISGIPFTFTDAAALPDGRIVFSAIAEDTENSYLDGACVGAAIGILAADRRLQKLERLQPGAKVEGVHARPDANRLQLLLVTDADDAAVPASLYAGELAL